MPVRRIHRSIVLMFLLSVITDQGCSRATGYWDSSTEVIAVNDSKQRLLLYDVGNKRSTVIANSCFGELRWSPDGTRIAYESYNRNNSMYHTIYVIDINSKMKRPIIVRNKDGVLEEYMGYWSNPVWSPDGDQVAVSFEGEMDFLIYRVYLREPGITPIRTTPGNNRVNDWSSLEHKIIFQSDWLLDNAPDPDHYSDVYIMNDDGTNVYRFMICDSTFTAGGFRYSPDGMQLAFVARESSSGNLRTAPTGIYVVDINGDNRRRIIEREERVGSLSWAPDGERIAFIMYPKGEHWTNGGNIFVVGMNDTTAVQITKGDLRYFSLYWRPISQ